MATIVNPTTIISGGGGGSVARPTTWAEFAAMTTAEQKAVYGIGDRVGLPCVHKSRNAEMYFKIANWGKTRLENDNTEYPCVVLVTETAWTGDFTTQDVTVVATEETATNGVYYFGYNNSTYTPLNLSVGDTIPYGDYNKIYKTEVTNDATQYANVLSKGWNNWKYSKIRQRLNSNTNNQYDVATHIGGSSFPQIGFADFMYDMPDDVKALLRRTEVVTAGNGITDDGSLYSTYDYMFIPSSYELGFVNTPIEGERMECFF